MLGRSCEFEVVGEGEGGGVSLAMFGRWVVNDVSWKSPMFIGADAWLCELP